MKKLTILGLLGTFMLTILVATGCGRGTIKTRSHWGWDRNVTVAKRHKKRRIRGRKRAVRATHYNRAPLNR